MNQVNLFNEINGCTPVVDTTTNEGLIRMFKHVLSKTSHFLPLIKKCNTQLECQTLIEFHAEIVALAVKGMDQALSSETYWFIKEVLEYLKKAKILHLKMLTRLDFLEYQLFFNRKIDDVWRSDVEIKAVDFVELMSFRAIVSRDIKDSVTI